MGLRNEGECNGFSGQTLGLVLLILPMEKNEIAEWATVLNTARMNAQPIAQLSSRVTGFSRADAYSIQETQLQRRLQDGELQAGWKMGLTSEAKRKQMNLDSPLYGFLTNRMQVPNGGRFVLSHAIHPKIEPEVAFRITQDLAGNVSREQVLSACSGVAACLEILDSRYEQFKYFSMEDVISDNSSSSHFVVGPWLEKFDNVDLANLKMEMSVDGKVVQSGNSRDISGDPVVSVQQLCQLLAERGQILKASSIVLAGAATAAVELKSGMRIDLAVEGLAPLFVEVAQ